ncbi:hypothetical protein [Sedimentitalea sp.]|uniref:hypothetical protein n=1 Tax=Sedimentitalea sp. TaxID=2048915 RepID=UPI003298B8D0
MFFTAQQSEEDLARDRMEADYFRNFWDWSEQQNGFATILGHLKSDQTADINHPLIGATRAPKTSSNDHAVAESYGRYETKIIEFVEDGGFGALNGCINIDELRTHLDAEWGKGVNDKSMASALKALGYRKLAPRVRLGYNRKLTRLYFKTLYEGGEVIAAQYMADQMLRSENWTKVGDSVLPIASVDAAVELRNGQQTTYGTVVNMPGEMFRFR